MSSHEPFVIVVGAGPSGLLLSLILAQNGIPVTLIEKTGTLDKQPRATHYAGPAVSVLRRAGVLPDMAAKGFFPSKLAFRTREEVLAFIDHTGLEDDQDRMRQPNVRLLWDHEVTDIKDDGGVGVVTATTPDGPKELRARFVVGCDGANSKIRRLLFGDWEFPGKTWDVQVVATNAYYNFHQFGYEDANFIIDPEHWYMASKITKDGMWRVSYGAPSGLTTEELREQLPEKWKQMLPGQPSPDDYRITNFSPYKVHQRLAESMRVGPFLLAADAAHLCNPFGGLGLTGGIVDVGGLVDCLIGIYKGRADDNILDIYSKVRREKYQQFVDPISSANLVRMHDKDPNTVLQRDEALQMMNSVGNDPVKRKALIDGINVINYDFTQHYHS
ncbi:hypothetical protein G7054_g5740 [Neopestalotiopsis clavispora]|nr:hypothetical protein G7054_g5740 [Neopestalotiopsis clavispora]